jgi:isopentenyl-diphosphate delta-isomerase, type 1
MEKVVLVDQNDQAIGLMDKMEAHLNPQLHRAFSIFIFNAQGKLLLQQRALSKYHSPGLWTNTCCSHPRDKESLSEATKRRLSEEMGMACDMHEAFSFIYKSNVGQGLTEYEFDHVWIGESDLKPKPNSEEVKSYKYMSISEISKDMKQNPENYTVWFRISFDRVQDYFHKHIQYVKE